MPELLTMQDLANGHLDVKALGEAANGDENTIVTTRTGETYPSLSNALNQIDGQISDANDMLVESVTTLFTNGGLPAKPFATKALMTASTLVEGDYAQVTDDTVNNGLYVKTSGAWIKSAYDPLAQAKADATAKDDAILVSSKEYTDIAEANAKAYMNLFAKPTNLYKKISGSVTVAKDVNGVLRVLSSSISGELINYAQATVKTIKAGDGITVLETAADITISTGTGSFEEPLEFVLCLIAGQSNATYYGGDETQSVAVPTGVCYTWNATGLNELNDGSTTSINTKKSYGAGLALEFYKRTGLGLIIVNAAVGSTAQTVAADNGSGNWDVSGTLRSTAVNRYNACKNYLDNNSWAYQNGFIAWTQGERDGAAIDSALLTKADYKNALSTMIDYFNTNIGGKLPFVLTTTAYYSGDVAKQGWKDVRNAQIETTHEKSGVYLGYTGAFKFASRGWLSDTVHYNQKAKNHIGKIMGSVTAKVSAGVN